MTTTTKRTKTQAKTPTVTPDDMAIRYHEWCLLKKQVAALEVELKTWATANGPIPTAPSKAWGPAAQVEQVILANIDDFDQSLRRIMGDDAAEIAVTRAVTQANLDAACSLLAKRQGGIAKNVREYVVNELTALGYIDSKTKTVFAERTIKIDG